MDKYIYRFVDISIFVNDVHVSISLSNGITRLNPKRVGSTRDDIQDYAQESKFQAANLSPQSSVLHNAIIKRISSPCTLASPRATENPERRRDDANRVHARAFQFVLVA